MDFNSYVVSAYVVALVTVYFIGFKFGMAHRLIDGMPKGL